jgi:hypothetical protein
VKLLPVQGATIGLLAPLAAPLVLLGGTLGGLMFIAVAVLFATHAAVAFAAARERLNSSRRWPPAT